MKKSGRIIEKNGDEVTIEFKRTSACENCKVCKSFEDASYATIHIKTNDSKFISMDTDISTACVGDTVDISISSKRFVGSVLILYGLPLVGLIIGALIGTFISNHFELGFEGLIAFGTAFLFMCVTFFFIRKITLKQEQNLY